ncbi:hypothetical protein ACFL5B_02160 [Candidatus Latescibacterota bacterium]
MNNQTKSSTIMYTVIDGYADLVLEDKQKAHSILDKSRDIIKPLVKQFNGEWHKDTLSSFGNPVEAVNCAQEIQRKLKDEPELNLRIGIHVSDIVFGEADGVKVASGIGPLAEPGGVCISDQVYYATRNQLGIEADFMGEKTLDNVDRLIKVYSLSIVEAPESKIESSKEKPKPSIAVLPFIDMSPEKDQEYFCDGITEEIINALSHVESMRIIARTSAFAFKGKQEDIREIGKKLDVETLLEGSVRKAGNKLRITAQLINVSDGSHLWSEAYNRELEDVFAIQEEISLSIVEVLKVKLIKTEKAAIVKRNTEDMEAYNLYLLGRFQWNKRTPEGYKKALDCYQQAIEKDSEYALAYTGIADTYLTLGIHCYMSPNDTFPKAENEIAKALEIDETLAEAHNTSALINLYYTWNWSAAEYGFKRAIKINPNYAYAHFGYSLYFLFMCRFEEALEELKRAQELDSMLLITYCVSMEIYSITGRYDEAMAQYKKINEIDPNNKLSDHYLGSLYEYQGKYYEAIEEYQKSIHPWSKSYLGRAYVMIGDREKAVKLLSELEEQKKGKYVSSSGIAIIYYSLGESDTAFEWYEKAYEERDSTMPLIKVFTRIRNTYSDPRFKALLKKMNLSED